MATAAAAAAAAPPSRKQLRDTPPPPDRGLRAAVAAPSGATPAGSPPVRNDACRHREEVDDDAAAGRAAEHHQRKVNARVLVNQLQDKLRQLSAELAAARQKNIDMSRRHAESLSSLEQRLAESIKDEGLQRRADDAIADRDDALAAQSSAEAARDRALHDLAQRDAQIASLQAEMAPLRARAEAEEKKANCLAARLVAAVRRDHIDETSELNFVLRMLSDEREATEAAIAAISSAFRVQLPFTESAATGAGSQIQTGAAGKKSGEGEDAKGPSVGGKVPASPFDGSTMERGTIITAQLHALEMGLRSRALESQAKLAAVQRRLASVQGVAADVLQKLNWCAVSIMNEKNEMEPMEAVGGIAGDHLQQAGTTTTTTAARARSLGTTTTISVGQSPAGVARVLGAARRAPCDVSDADTSFGIGGSAAGDGFLEPTPPRHGAYDATSSPGAVAPPPPPPHTGTSASGGGGASSGERVHARSTIARASRVLPLAPPSLPHHPNDHQQQQQHPSRLLFGSAATTGGPSPQLPMAVVRTSESLFDTLDDVHDALLDAIEDMKAVEELELDASAIADSSAAPTVVAAAAEADAMLKELCSQFEEFRHAAQRSALNMAERLDREVRRHHESMIDMKQRVAIAEAEYTRLLLESQHLPPEMVDKMQARFLEIVNGSVIGLSRARRPLTLAEAAPRAGDPSDESRMAAGTAAVGRPTAVPQLPATRVAEVAEFAPPTPPPLPMPRRPATAAYALPPPHHDAPSVDVSAVMPGSTHTSVQRQRSRSRIVSPDF